MSHDPVRQRTFLFGGSALFGLTGDTWSWDGLEWVQVASLGPSPRFGHAMAYHPPSGRIVLFGGEALSTWLGDTWSWDGVSWTEVLIPGPTPRSEHTMATDPSRGRIVLFGGRDTGQGSAVPKADTWEWTGIGWAPIVTAAAPGRWGHCMCTDVQPGGVLMYGGSSLGTDFDDTWAWDGIAWQQVSATGVTSRSRAAMVLDAGRNRCVLYGGLSAIGGTSVGTETWEWDGQSWSQLVAASAERRHAHVLAYDAHQQQIVMFGGFGVSGFEGTTHVSVSPVTGSFGVGCGTPPLEVAPTPGSRPRLGAAQSTDVTGVPNSPCAVAIGFSRTMLGAFTLPLPLDGFGMTGCWLHHDAAYPGLLPCPPAVAGLAQHTLPIPADSALNGARVFLQAVALAPGENPFGLVTSNGIELRLAP
ncbi:MAG: kelch repeat-containing protein [Planctomycetota bacterium]